MIPSLISQLQVFIASLATIALSTTPIPTQQGFTTNSSSATNIESSGNSRNWAGYVASNGSFTAINGTWTIPQVATSGHTASDATWIGIGGVSSNDLIQGGTQNVITPRGQVTTSAFYELLPNISVPVSSLTVKPGDSITVSLHEQSANQWLITFNDNTTGQNYQTTVEYNSSLSSAEWIEEAPSNEVNVLPLDNFGTVEFSQSATTQNGSNQTLSGSGATAITMVNGNGQAIATSSSVGSDDESFTVTRSSAVSNAPNPGYDRNPGSWRRRGRGIGFGNHNGAGYYPAPTYPTATPQQTGMPTNNRQSFHFKSRWRVLRFSQF